MAEAADKERLAAAAASRQATRDEAAKRSASRALAKKMAEGFDDDDIPRYRDGGRAADGHTGATQEFEGL